MKCECCGVNRRGIKAAIKVEKMNNFVLCSICSNIMWQDYLLYVVKGFKGWDATKWTECKDFIKEMYNEGILR